MRKFLIITTIVIIASTAYYLSRSDLDNADNQDQSVGEELVLVEPDPVFAEPVTFGQLKELYSGDGFSFKYSSGYKITSVPAELDGVSTETVTIENENRSGFQIFILAWDEPGPITPERIWQDLPDAQVNDPKNADLDGSKTLVFNGYDEDMGETFEAWTVHKGELYQISGPVTAEELIVETLNTWEWK